MTTETVPHAGSNNCSTETPKTGGGGAGKEDLTRRVGLPNPLTNPHKRDTPELDSGSNGQHLDNQNGHDEHEVPKF